MLIFYNLNKVPFMFISYNLIFAPSEAINYSINDHTFSCAFVEILFDIQITDKSC